MKIMLSKKQRGQRRHVVMTCTVPEASEIRGIIYHEVLRGEVYPVSENYFVPQPTGARIAMTRFRLHMRYMERLMLTFPFADFSPGLTSRLSAQAQAELRALPIPENLDLGCFTGDLRDYQKQAVGVMLPKEQSRFSLEDDLGLGKSWELLAILAAKRAVPAVIVVRNSIKFMWARFVEQLTDYTYGVLDGTAAERASILEQEPDIVIANHEALRVKKWQEDDAGDGSNINPETGEPWVWYNFKNPALFFRGADAYKQDWREDELKTAKRKVWRFAGVDEYHNYKNPTAQQTYGLHQLKAKRKLGMSGTPFINGRPEERWSILHWLWPERWPSYAQFLATYCIRRGSRVIAYQGLADLREFLAQHSLRRRKEQVIDQLPTVTYVDDMIDLTPEQRRLYNEIFNRMLLWIDEEPRSIVNALAQLTRLKQACFSPELYGGSQHSAKMTRLKEIVEELVREGHKAIIFSQWSKATRIMQRELEQYNPAYIDGTVKPRDRMDEVDKFNNDEDCKIFIGTIGACREGFTLSAATYVIFTDKGWTPAENYQAAGRSAAGGLRGEGVERVTIIEIKANNTIEEDIEELLARKQRMNNRLTERDAGPVEDRISMGDIRDLLRGGRTRNRDEDEDAA